MLKKRIVIIEIKTKRVALSPPFSRLFTPLNYRGPSIPFSFCSFAVNILGIECPKVQPNFFAALPSIPRASNARKSSHNQAATHFSFLTSCSTFPFLSIINSKRADFVAESTENPGSGEQNTVPSVAFTFLASAPALFTT